MCFVHAVYCMILLDITVCVICDKLQPSRISQYYFLLIISDHTFLQFCLIYLDRYEGCDWERSFSPPVLPSRSVGNGITLEKFIYKYRYVCVLYLCSGGRIVNSNFFFLVLYIFNSLLMQKTWTFCSDLIWKWHGPYATLSPVLASVYWMVQYFMLQRTKSLFSCTIASWMSDTVIRYSYIVSNKDKFYDYLKIVLLS